MTASIIIPVFNEGRFISALITRVLNSDISPFSKEIIVVDDGSNDETAKILGGFSERGVITLITHKKNIGKAGAIKSALKAATGEVIIIQDADLEYSPEDYKLLLQPFTEPETKVVYGSRFLSKRWPSRMKPANWLANKLFVFLVNFLYGAHITDEGTALKLFRRTLINSLEIKCSGFEFCPEVTAKLLKKGIKIIEVPISYEARRKTEGKKPGFKDGLKILRTIIKYRFTAG